MTRVHSSLCSMTNGGFILECHCPQGKGITGVNPSLVLIDEINELTHEDWCEDPNCHHKERP